jgi:PhoH-like ATPase
VILAESGATTNTFAVDTHVLMLDPVGLCTLQEPQVCLPMTVLEELDNAKIGVSEVTRNLRQPNRFILGHDLRG